MCSPLAGCAVGGVRHPDRTPLHEMTRRRSGATYQSARFVYAAMAGHSCEMHHLTEGAAPNAWFIGSRPARPPRPDSEFAIFVFIRHRSPDWLERLGHRRACP